MSGLVGGSGKVREGQNMAPEMDSNKLGGTFWVLHILHILHIWGTWSHPSKQGGRNFVNIQNFLVDFSK